MQLHRVSRAKRLFRSKWVLTLAGVALAATAWATPPLGFVVNQILASAVAPHRMNENIEINKNADGTRSPWHLELEVRGDTDYYSQHLELVPAGYSGWHSHPGLLIAGVQSGEVDFYDANCRKKTVKAGEVYTESDAPHAIINRGAVNADLYISYLVKHGQPRRREESAPACAIYTGIP